MQHYPEPSRWGADSRPEQRPGVPKELAEPQAVGGAHWTVPEQQTTPRASSISPSRQLTPVYASTNPARGLSGVIRRAAYRYPEYRARRWMLLVLADRVDVLEHNPRRTALWFALGVGAYLLATRGRRAMTRAALGPRTEPEY